VAAAGKVALPMPLGRLACRELQHGDDGCRKINLAKLKNGQV
jgi:hypothetical protein